MWVTSSLQSARQPSVVALGNFDGIHLGHQQVMAKMLSATGRQPRPAFSATAVSALHDGFTLAGYSALPTDTSTPPTESSLNEQTTNTQTTVVTFSPHPHEFFTGQSRPLLTPIHEKTWHLAQMGIQQLVMLPFTRALAELSPQDFVESILIEGLQAKCISVGSDFHFGKGRSGNAQILADIAGHHHVPVIQVPLKESLGERISSSRIREALAAGQPSLAAQLLGRPYTLTGRVVRGQQVGRTIGFPTANLHLPDNKFLPCNGVYSVQVYGPKTEALPGVMNIGQRPTVNGINLSIEVHLLDWSGDLYEQILTVSLLDFIRPEQRFDSLELLKAQIQKDCQLAKSQLFAH